MVGVSRTVIGRRTARADPVLKAKSCGITASQNRKTRGNSGADRRTDLQTNQPTDKTDRDKHINKGGGGGGGCLEGGEAAFTDDRANASFTRLYDHHLSGQHLPVPCGQANELPRLAFCASCSAS